jgi:hypothetical protein
MAKVSRPEFLAISLVGHPPPPPILEEICIRASNLKVRRCIGQYKGHRRRNQIKGGIVRFYVPLKNISLIGLQN